MKGFQATGLLAFMLAALGWLSPAGGQTTAPTTAPVASPAPSPAPTSAPAEGPTTVIDVRVDGNTRMSAGAVLANVKTRPGQNYNEQLVIQDEQALLKTRHFESVRTFKTQTDQGIVVTFQVVERAALEALRLEGVKSLKEKDIRDLVPINPGDAVDQLQIDTAIRNIQTKYRSEGYYFVQVTFDKPLLIEKRQLLLRVVEGPRVYVRKISFQGNRTFSTAKLETLIVVKTRFWPFVTGAIDVDAIERDVAELTNFYRGEGFLDAQVAAAPLVFSPDKRRAELTYVIDEGPRYRIRQVNFEGNVVYAPDEIRKCIKSTPGEFYNGTILKADLDRIKNSYGEIGYINIEVVAKTPFAPSAASQPGRAGCPQVDIVFTINEGGQYRVGAIDIRGNYITHANVIRRQMQIYPGQLYNAVAAEESQKALSETQLFKKATVTPYGNAPDVRNALVNIEEGQTGQATVGVGVNSNTGLMGSVTYMERNFEFRWPTDDDIKQGRAFRGAGQTFRVSVEPGLQQSNARVDWFEPYLFDKPYSLGAAGYGFTAQREDWQESRVGGNVALGHRYFNGWYGEVGQRVEGVFITDVKKDAPQDVKDVEGANLVTGTKGTLVRDKTDSRWLPSTGDRLSLSYEQVYGQFNFGRPEVDYHRYWTLYTDELDRKQILAGRVMAGDIIGDAPVFERFYGGGIGSLRGFKYRGISPRQGPADDPIGGDWTVFAGSEYTFPLVGKFLRGAAFVDTGTVEPKIGMGSYRVSAGVGIRLHLPFFGPVPMSLDFGIPVIKRDHDDTQIVSFNVGWVF